MSDWRLTPQNSALVVIDVQEKLMNVIPRRAESLASIQRLIGAARSSPPSNPAPTNSSESYRSLSSTSVMMSSAGATAAAGATAGRDRSGRGSH